MSAYIVLGLIILVAVVIGVLIAAFEKGKCQPKDYYRGRKK